MRINKEDIKIIKTKVKEIFGEVETYIFGSILNDKKRGGDIDIFIRTDFNKDTFNKKIKLQMLLEDMLFRPIDIVIEKENNQNIKNEALRGLKIC